MDSFQADKLQRLASRVQFKDFKKFRLKTKPDIYNKVLRFSEIAQKNEAKTSELVQEVREQVCSLKRRSHKMYKLDNINSGQNMKLKENIQHEFCVAIDSSDFESNRNFNGNVNKDFDGRKCEKYVETSKNNAEISDRKYYYGDLCNFINQYVEPSFNESCEHFNRGNVLPNSLNEQDASIEYEDSSTCLDVAEINEPTTDSKIYDFQSEAMFDDNQFDLSYAHKDVLEDKIASIDENVLRNSFHLVDVKGTNPLYWDQCSYGIPLNNNNTSSRFRIATKPIDDDMAGDEDDDYDEDEDESYYRQNSSTPISPSCSTNTRSTEIQRSDSYFTDNSLQTYYKPVKHTRFKPASNETGTQTVAHKAVDAKPRLFYVDEKSKEGKGVIVPKTKKRRKDKNTFTNRLSGKPRNSLEEIPSSEESDSYPENNNAEQKQIIIRWGNFSKMISSERIKKEHKQDDVKKEHKQDDVKKKQTEDDIKKECGVISENKGIVTSFAATNGSYDLVSSASYDVVPTNFAGKFVDDEDVLSENFVEKVVLLERKCSSDYIDMDFEGEVKTKSSKGCHDLMREFKRHPHNKAFASFNIGDSVQLCFSEKNAVNSNNHSSIDRELMSDYTSNIIECDEYCDDKNGFCINAASYPSNSGATKLSGFPKNFGKIKNSRICRRIKLNNNTSPQCDNFDLGDCGNSQVVCGCHKGLNETYCRSNCLVHSRKYNQLTIEDKSQMHNYRLSDCDINQEMDECDICKSVCCVESEGCGDYIHKFEGRMNSSNSYNSELFFENVNNNNDFSNKSIQSMFDMCHDEDCHHNQDVTSLMCPHNIQRLSELLRRLQKSLLLPDCNKTFPQKVSLDSSSEDNYSKLSENCGQGETRFNDKSEFHELFLLSDLNNFQSQDVIATDLPFENQNEVSTNRIINPVNQLEEGSGVRYKSPQVTQNVPAKITKPSINKDRSSRGYGKDKCNKMRIRIKTGYETDISESDYSGCDVNHHRKSTKIRFFKSRSRRSIQNKTRRCRLSSSESSNSEERKKLFGKKILKCRSEMKYKDIDDNNNNTYRYYSPAHHRNKFIMKDIKWPSKSSKESRNLYPMNVTNYPDDYELKSVKRMFKERDIIRKFLISELERLRESLEKERRTFLGELSATRQQIKDYEQNQRRKMEHLESLVCQRLECYDRMIHNQNACPYSPCPYNEPVAIIPNDNRFYASNYDPNFAMTHLKSSTTLNDQMNLKPLAISNYHPNFEQFSTLRHNEFVSSDMKGENIQNYHIKSRDLQQFIPTNGRFLPPTLALKNEKTLKKEHAYSRRRHSVNGSARDTSNLKENVSGKWTNLENKPYEGPFFNTSPRTRFESDFAPHTNFTKVRDSYLDLPVKSPNLHNFEKNCKIQSLGNKIENKVYHSTATQYPKQTRSNQVTPQTKHSSNQTVQPACSNKLTQRNTSPIGTSCDRSFLSSEVEKVMRSSLASEKQEPYKTLLANKITTIARSPAINVTHFNQINQDIAPEMKPTTIDFKKNHSKNNNNSYYDAMFKSTEPDVVLASDRKPEINQNRGQNSLRGTGSEDVFFLRSNPPTTIRQESIIPRENFKDSLDFYIHDVQKSNRTNRSETSQKFKSAEGFIFTEEEICRKNWKGINNNDGSIKTLFSRWTVI